MVDDRDVPEPLNLDGRVLEASILDIDDLDRQRLLSQHTASLPELDAEDERWNLTEDEIDAILYEEVGCKRRRARAVQCRAVLDDLIVDPAAREALTMAWSRHVDANESADRPPRIIGSPVFLSHLPDGLGGLFARNRVEIMSGLGRDLAAVVFTGPRFNLILVDDAEPRDAILFRTYHMMMHLMVRHLNAEDYSFRFEWRHGVRPVLSDDPVLEATYRDQEAEADDAAVCLMHSAYSDQEFSKAFLRQAVAQGSVRPSAIRSALHNRSYLYHVLASTLRVFTPAPLRDALHPLTQYTGALALATGPHHPVYLLQRVHDSPVPYKRWIPSRKVLSRLGAENGNTDIVWFGQGELDALPDGPMLWDPDEVDAARHYLLETSALVKRPAAMTSGNQRVPGLQRETEALVDLWPSVRHEPQALLISSASL